METSQIPFQDTYLNLLRKERAQVSIYLTNGIKLMGFIDTFDAFVIVLKCKTAQVVYKHAIATIVPVKPVNVSADKHIGAAKPADRYDDEQEKHWNR